MPGGRQRLVKVFPLQHLPAADLTEKVKSVLSKDAVVVTDDRANVMIVTDYNDNLAAAAELITALDVEKNDDVIVRVINIEECQRAGTGQADPAALPKADRQAIQGTDRSLGQRHGQLADGAFQRGQFQGDREICHLARHRRRAGEGDEDL